MALSGYMVLVVSAACGMGLFLLAWAWSVRRRRRRAVAEGGAVAETRPADPMARLLEQRIEAMESRIGEMAARQATGSSDEKLQAMAGSLLTLVRDKNAAMDTAMAGLDQLRARMRTLEQIGDVAEARGLFEGLGARLDTVQAAQSAGEAALTARLTALEAAEPGAALAGQFSRLIEHKDAALAAVIDRIAPIEARLDELRAAQAEMAGPGAFARMTQPMVERIAALEAALGERDPQPVLDAFAARLDAVQSSQDARFAVVEQAAADPRRALDRFAERLEALQERVASVEVAGSNPFGEISEQLTRLYAQKDAAMETVLAHLAPLESRLSALEAAERDPKAALDAIGARFEALQARVGVLETPGENPFTEISEQLARLYAQKDATVEAVFVRLAPLELRLGAMERDLAAANPQAMLDRFAERLAGLQGRVTDLEAPGDSPFAEISEQLTRLYAQKDATVETVFARLAPLEARLGAIEAAVSGLDPQAALERFEERLEALEAPGENPFAEISEQLTRLYAQKDATVETVFARLAPLEARLGVIEASVAGQDPQAMLDRFAERLEGLQARVADLEAPGENPFAEISEQLTRLYAQKDATVETVFARLAPLEARLGTIEASMSGQDPQAALERFAERLAAVEAEAAGSDPRIAALEAADPRAELAELGARIAELQVSQGAAGERLAALQDAMADAHPFTAISEQLAQLYAQKDAAVEAVAGRLAPLEARLRDIELRPEPASADEARAQAEEIATQMMALRAAAAQTELFADRLALIEASLPRLSAAQSLMLQALERQGVSAASRTPAAVIAPPPEDPPAAPADGTAGVLDLTDLPRVVSLHHG